MPALVNYSGDDEFYSGNSFPVDLGRLCSIGSHVDVYCPPRKRARIAAPFEHNKQPSIDVLPDECLYEIFKHMPAESKERSMSAFVSKHWLSLMTSIRKSEFCKEKVNPDSGDTDTIPCDSDDGFLTRCLEGKKATDLRLAAIAVGTSSRGGLGKLSIRGNNYIHGVTNLGLSAIARGCPSLKALSLWNVHGVSDDGLIEIAKECRFLEKLDLCQCPSITSKGLIAIAENCPNLSSLSVESCGKIGNEGLQAIGKLCTKLQIISMKDCPLVGDHGVSSLLSSACSSITKVKFQNLNITDFSLAVLGHYGKAITNLTICNLQNVSERGFWVMGNAQGLQKLVSLTVSSCRGVTDVSLGAIGTSCQNLKKMCLRKFCFLSDNGLITFAKSAKSLENLQLEECNRISQNGVVGILSNLKSLTLVKCMGLKETPLEISVPGPCNSLRSLCVRNCTAFGNTSLAFIGQLCPQLQHIELSNLCGVTDSGLLPLVENSEAGLVKVNLNGCLNVTDKTISALARLHGTTLESLNLDGCRMITDLSLMAVAENCMFISDLDLSKCGITDSGIAVLSRANQLNLRILSLSGCAYVSNKSRACGDVISSPNRRFIYTDHKKSAFGQITRVTSSFHLGFIALPEISTSWLFFLRYIGIFMAPPFFYKRSRSRKLVKLFLASILRDVIPFYCHVTKECCHQGRVIRFPQVYNITIRFIVTCDNVTYLLLSLSFWSVLQFMFYVLASDCI
ncbi:hypothetical protein ACFE04_010934 [Oxalis oulophora]